MILAVKRVQELMVTGASTILTSCPGCVIQLMEAVKDLKANVKVADLAQILDEASGWS
jgi:Fe-S oxidoreductase